MVFLDPATLAGALRGRAFGYNIIAPGPGHSLSDRSLSVKIVPSAPEGFIVHSFAGDSLQECREYVRRKLGPTPRPQSSPPYSTGFCDPSVASREIAGHCELALRLWKQARNPRETLVETYLHSRGLGLPHDLTDDVLRFHDALSLDGTFVGAMVALFRDIETNEPCGIHRTFLGQAGQKLDRRMLGRARNAGIKLDADENIALGLCIGEGVETCIAGRLCGFRPVWALGSVAAISTFPVLPGIEALTILGERGDRGANYRAARACADRWIEAGREAFLVEPLIGGDLNDVWREVSP